MRSIHKCPSCNKYTMNEQCKECNDQALMVKPPKYSAKYRRVVLRPKLEETGVL